MMVSGRLDESEKPPWWVELIMTIVGIAVLIALPSLLGMWLR